MLKNLFRKKNPNHLQAVAGMHEADDVLDNDNYFKAKAKTTHEMQNMDFYRDYREVKVFNYNVKHERKEF